MKRVVKFFLKMFVNFNKIFTKITADTEPLFSEVSNNLQIENRKKVYMQNIFHRSRYKTAEEFLGNWNYRLIKITSKRKLKNLFKNFAAKSAFWSSHFTRKPLIRQRMRGYSFRLIKVFSGYVIVLFRPRTYIYINI